MQQPHKPNINENSASSATKFGKKPSIKINGQIESNNKQDVPIVPAKPARLNLALKREPNATASPIANGQMNAKTGSTTAPAVNTTETDEIEFLLEEIKDLEVPACRTDSEQDFEIAGSRVDLDLSLQLDSPIDTSWYYSSIIFILLLEINEYFFFFFFLKYYFLLLIGLASSKLTLTSFQFFFYFFSFVLCACFLNTMAEKKTI